ncbi:MAG: 50S ribosomal protein L4 [Verrucomicrobia bacterium]|nr:50S ribosomal protein L4 [Verrucomicrobiota bacterium]
MAGKVITVAAAKKANIDVIEDRRGTQAVHEVVTAMRANRRSGTANTKTRGEVKHSNKKPWRQKGTGRARAGRTASPIWRGGGVAFGPRPRSYAKQTNKSTKRLAFRKALSERIMAGDVVTVASFKVADGKTKSFVAAVKEAVEGNKVLIIAREFDESTFLAGRNHVSTLLMSAAEVNTENLLYFDKIVVVKGALEILATRTGAASEEKAAAAPAKEEEKEAATEA